MGKKGNSLRPTGHESGEWSRRFGEGSGFYLWAEGGRCGLNAAARLSACARQGVMSEAAVTCPLGRVGCSGRGVCQGRSRAASSGAGRRWTLARAAGAAITRRILVGLACAVGGDGDGAAGWCAAGAGEMAWRRPVEQAGRRRARGTARVAAVAAAARARPALSSG